MTDFTFERNHEPDQQGIWFPYTGFRYKDYYDIELHDGTLIEHMRPNGHSWHGLVSVPIKDEQVAKIRLIPDDELDDYHIKGEARVKQQLKLFGEKESGL